MVHTRRLAGLRDIIADTLADLQVAVTSPFATSTPPPTPIFGTMSSDGPSSSGPSNSSPATPTVPPTNPLADLTPDQLAAVFQTFASLHNSATVPPPVSNSNDTHRRSHRATTLTTMASSLPKLKEGKYSEWEFAVGDAIRIAGLWDYISGDASCPTDPASRDYDVYVQESGAVRAAIIGALDHETSFRYLTGTKTPKEAWDALRTRYRVSDEAELRALDEELMGLRLDEGGNLIEHVAKFKRLRRQLDGSEFELTPSRAIQWMWKSLPPSYSNIVLLQRRLKASDFDAVCLELESHYRTEVANSGPSVVAFAASTANRSSLPRDWNIPEDLRRLRLTGSQNPALAERAKITCRDCLMTGHYANSEACNKTRYCLELFGPRQPRNNRNNFRSGRQANAATTESTGGAKVSEVSANATSVGSSEFPGAFPEYIAMSASIVEATGDPTALAACSETTFLLDSGCQCHMTSVRSIFTRIQELPSPVKIRGIGDSCILARSVGTIAIPTTVEGNLSWLCLDNVLYAPELGRNLISTGALMEAGLAVLSTSKGATISNPDENRVLATASLKDRLWVLDVDNSIWEAQSAPMANVATSGLTWHKRLAHPGTRVLQKLAESGMIDKLTKKDLDEISRCESCALGKAARKPFPVSSSRASQPLELVHSDICGPFDPSVTGSKYVLMFVDDFSNMMWACFLKAKSDTLTAFVQLRTLLEKSSGFQIKTLRTDNGGEYTSHAMSRYLADAGILHQTLCPNSSQQNGKVERSFRTAFDPARCLMAEAKVSWCWWEEALRTSVRLHNVLPCSSLPGFASPMSVWLNKPCINMRSMKVFGSICFAVDTSKHRKKLAPRAIKCRFLGYDLSSKAYRLQVFGTNRIIKSRDVIFHEDRHLALIPDPSLMVPKSEVADSVGEAKPPVSVGESTKVKDDAEISVGEVTPNQSVPSTPQPRRSERLKRKPGTPDSVGANAATVPRSFREAMRSEESREWEAAIGGEFASWIKKDVCEAVLRPEDEEILPTMLVFSRKTDPNGVEVKKKCRCVVIGSRQSQTPVSSTTLPESTASPVAHTTTLRVLASLAATEGWEFQQMDVNTAYLHAPLKRATYISIPPGFPDSKLLPNIPRSQQVLRLKKAVYGLREAPHAWYEHCAGQFLTEGFTRSTNDYCLFTVKAPQSDDLCFVLVYVDDFTLVTKTPEQMSWLKRKLATMFDIKDLGAADQLLGMEVTRDRDAGTIKLSQKKFTKKLLEEYDLLECRPRATPMNSNALSALPSHLTLRTKEESDFMMDKDYRHLLGCLNWLAQGTRPDIAYAIARLGQAQSNPHPAHWQALIHVLRYLSSTIDMGLTYSASAEDKLAYMFTDSAFADCPETRKSHSGYVTLLGGAAVSWSSRKQTVVTTSSTEAEYLAMGHATKEARWMRRLLDDLGKPVQGPLRIYADNQSSLLLADSDKTSSRTKHLDVQYHFVRQHIKDGSCQFLWVPSKLNAADVFTKPLGQTLFESMPPMLGLPWYRRLYGPESTRSEVSDIRQKPRVGVLGDGVTGGSADVGDGLAPSPTQEVRNVPY